MASRMMVTSATNATPAILLSKNSETKRPNGVSTLGGVVRFMSVICFDPVAGPEDQEWNIEYKQGTYTYDKLKKSVEGAGFGIERVWLNGELIIDNRKKKK